MKQAFPYCFVFEVSCKTCSLTAKAKDPLETTPEIVEDAVKYIIFLVDADSLFDLALGMYDFSLVLMIAQHAQKVLLSSKVKELH